MRKEQFVESEYYHIYNRGVDRRPIFLNDREKLRFVHSLYILNNFLDIPTRFDVVSLEPKELLTPIEPYVEIVATCLMSNHFHLMLTPKKKDGVSKFMQKISLSHTNYFNKLHERTGRLFESTFKAKHVDRHEYAAYLTQYIHLNPIDLYRTKFGTKEGIRYVENYRWSSLPTYLGKKNPLSLVVSEQFRDKVLGVNAPEYQKFLQSVYDDLYRT